MANDLDALAIILGGGRGSRLYPLTKMRAKPAVPLGGKYRLIDIPISNCINSGIHQVYVLTQFLTASLHRHVYDTYKFDVFSDGFVDLMPAEQTLTSEDWYQGTADAVRRQLDRLRRKDHRDVVILSGDHLYRMDFTEFLAHHQETEADLTIAVIPITREDAPRFGILKTDREGWIRAFHEKPKLEEDLDRMESHPGTSHPYLGSMGIYIFRREKLIQLLETNPRDDFGRDIIPEAIQQQRVSAYRFHGYWEDIGTIQSFFESNLALTQDEPTFDLYDPKRPIFTRSRFLPPSWLDRCQLNQVVVADGCRIQQAELDQAVMGLRSVVREKSRLHRVVMLGADYYEDESDLDDNQRIGRPNLGVGQGCRIERAILDKNVRIGDGVVIRSHQGTPDGDWDEYSIRDGIVVIPKNATIPAGTEI